MKASEIMETASTGASCAGSMAPVESALGGTITRLGGSMLSGKYSTDPTPNTPKEYKRNKHVNGRFKNSPGN